MGYQAELAATRRCPAMLAMVVAFANVLFLIVDLDRGREGFLTVDQTAMTDLQRSIHNTETPSRARFAHVGPCHGRGG